MSIIHISKKFSFEMAHVLYGHDGKCKNVHGHSYQLTVTIKGTPLCNPDSPKNGMVMDFSDLKSIVNSTIISKFDHKLVLNEHTPYKSMLDGNLPSGNIVLVPYQPTSENLICDFAGRIKEKLPLNIKLYRLILQETSTSFVEWLASDNE